MRMGSDSISRMLLLKKGTTSEYHERMNVVITGASRGIGLELASVALGQGDQLFVVARKPEESPELRTLKSKYRDQLSIATIELTDPGAAELLEEELHAWDYIDVLINNAGV